MGQFKPPPTPPSPTSTTQKVTQTVVDRNGFTWKLQEPRLTGQYITGDWWVYGSVDVVDITPESKQITDEITKLPRWVNGSQINPSPKESLVASQFNPGAVDVRQGFDEGMFYKAVKGQNPAWAGKYKHSLNRRPPFRLDPGDSLVSTLTQTRAAGSRSQVEKAGILTCVSTIPDDNDFRPGYTRYKGDTYSFSGVDLAAKGLSLDPATTTPTSVSYLEDRFAGPWLAHIPGSSKQYIHPEAWMPFYSRDHTVVISEAALTLLRSDLIADDVRTLAIGMIQAGLDWWNIWNDRHEFLWHWSQGAGISNGVRFLIMLAGHLLSDATIESSSLLGNEVMQPFVVAETSTGQYNYGIGGYGATRPSGLTKWAAVGDPEWGTNQYLGEDGTLGGSLGLHPFAASFTSILWYDDDIIPGFEPTGIQVNSAKYRTCCSAACWWGEALYVLERGLRTKWNTGLLDADVWWQYLDRFRIVQNGLGSTLHAGGPWAVEMWDKFRAGYAPAVWTP